MTIDIPVQRKECHSCCLPAVRYSGETRELEIKPRGVMVPKDCCESKTAVAHHIQSAAHVVVSFNLALWISLTFQLALSSLKYIERSFWPKKKKKLPKEYAGVLLFRSINLVLRGRDQPVDFAEELIVIKFHGTQDTMKVLAALARGAIYARVTINALKNTSSYFNLFFLCIPELWSLANWSALKNFKYSINFKLL